MKVELFPSGSGIEFISNTVANKRMTLAYAACGAFAAGNMAADDERLTFTGNSFFNNPSLPEERLAILVHRSHLRTPNRGCGRNH